MTMRNLLDKSGVDRPPRQRESGWLHTADDAIRDTLRHVVAGLALLFAAAPLAATSVVHRNLGELIALAEAIVVADVVAVADGFDGGLPFTEVELDVREALLGGSTGRYTFRQFGLLEPRPMTHGRTSALVSPPGWPRFVAGERVLLFLYEPASRSGLRTTVGLFQGKFIVEGPWIRNEIDNAGLFDRLELPVVAGPDAQRLARRPGGPLLAEELLDLIRQAVREQWFE
jgi:hypothetical protein